LHIHLSMTLSYSLSTLFPYTTLFRSGLQDRVSAPQLQHFLTKPAVLLHQLRTRPVAALTAVGLVLADPVPQRLVMHTQLLGQPRSEEHTSELQSRENLVCLLLLEKKK